MVLPQGRRFGGWTRWLLLWLFLAIWASTSCADDVDVLLEIAAIRVPPHLSDWNAGNVSRVCEWTGVTCNSRSFVKDLDFSVPDRSVPILAGVFPSSIVNLTSLRSLRLNNNRVIGTIPPAFWQLPNIEKVALSNTAMTVVFPPNVSQTLFNIALDDTITTGPIPSLNWPRLADLDFGDTSVECPLPQSLIDYHNALDAAPSNYSCRFGRSKMWVDPLTQKVCGQIHISKFWCELFPLQEPFVDFQRSPPPVLTPQYVVNASNIRAEFYRDEVLFFGTYTQRNASVIHRDEYVKFKMYGLSAQTRYTTPDGSSNRTNFAFTGFETFFWNASSSTLYATSHAGPNNIFQVDYIFNFNPAVRMGYDTTRPTVKFSLRIQNFGWDWGPSASPKVADVPLAVTYRAPHSPYGGPVIECSGGYTLTETCSSATSDLVLEYDPRPDVQTYSTNLVRRNKIALSYIYDTKATIDGVGLVSAISISLSKLFGGVGFINQLLDHRLLNQSSVFSPLIQQENAQSFSLLILAQVPRFRTELLYDPDVSIQLLFGTDLPPEGPTTPGTGTAVLPEGINTVAVVVGVLVAIAVAFLGVTVFAKFVFPFMKLRLASKLKGSQEFDDETGAAPPISSSAPPSHDPSKRWTTAKPADNLTNSVIHS
eukprot:TRINITY_DN6838_c0_g1_i1.p1 TRINITY_DN6838_c0_g1~~TRINITY_DN6838_c0_g1_i1.p1  ORF type:complete len:651 (-),score=64.84 TRINITY_DN6838_c0_g1_i1:75-2027(-)